MLNEVEINMPLVVTDEEVDDIMALALDSGISHWCCRVDVVGEYLSDEASDQISKGGGLNLLTIDGERYMLDKEKLLNGLKLAAEDSLDYLENFYDLFEVTGNCIRIRETAIDSELADGIVQFALFGDVTYA